jgi:Holliday junction resolvasome RuvABC DNA-binding subunit
LEKLGFSHDAAREAVSEVLVADANLGAGEILRKALAQL